MPSQLWERLRAARRFADLTQAQLAAVCNVTRSGYAFMESKDPNSRTRPSADQVMAIAKLTRVPVEWLLNDAADAGDVWKIGVIASGVSQPVAAPAPRVSLDGQQHPLRRINDGPERLARLFWSSVEFQVVTADPSLGSAFDAVLLGPPLPLTVRYLHGRSMACFSNRCDSDALTAHMGRLLLNERAVAKVFDKHLIVWCPEDHGNGAYEMADKVFGIKIRQVQTAEEAAAYLLSLK